MLIDVSKDVYRKHFPEDSNPYISEPYIGLVEHKTDKVVRLLDPENNSSIGLLTGVKDNILSSPFSAPFGGFHFIHEDVYYEEIFNFLTQLKEYAIIHKLQKMEITLPPSIYNSSLNAKLVNAFIRLGFTMQIPDIVNWVNLTSFNEKCVRKRVEEKLKAAKKANLSFIHVTDENMMAESYEVISNNRTMLGRGIYVSFAELLDINKIFPVDFFLVKNNEGENIGAAVFYRGHKKIVQGIFWGDIIPRKPFPTMDFLVVNIFSFYKILGFDYIDLARSSKDGIPNEGLIRFKEVHNCISSNRFTFSWTPPAQPIKVDNITS